MLGNPLMANMYKYLYQPSIEPVLPKLAHVRYHLKVCDSAPKSYSGNGHHIAVSLPNACIQTLLVKPTMIKAEYE